MHNDLWPVAAVQLGVSPDEEYFSIPRGRVLYDPRRRKSSIYHGNQTEASRLKLIAAKFELDEWEARLGEHYLMGSDADQTQEQITVQLAHPLHGFLGYGTLARLELNMHDITPNGWTQHLSPDSWAVAGPQHAPVAKAPYGLLEILEREEEFDDRHVARRLAILFLGADGIATYDALFCQECGNPPPYAVLL